MQLVGGELNGSSFGSIFVSYMKVAGVMLIVARGNPQPPALGDNPDEATCFSHINL